MDPVTPSLFDEPREETWATRLWGRWGSVLIVPLLVVVLFGFKFWYQAKAQGDEERRAAMLANMHQAVTEDVYARRLLSPVGSFIAPFPFGRYLLQEGTSDLWAVSVPMAWEMAGTGERRIGLATGMIRRFENQNAFRVESLEVINPAGRDREFVERKLKESRSGELWIVGEPAK